jgi:hypothetical protein
VTSLYTDEHRTDYNFNVAKRHGNWVMIRGDAGMPHCSSSPEAYRAAGRIAAVNKARGPQ